MSSSLLKSAIEGEFRALEGTDHRIKKQRRSTNRSKLGDGQKRGERGPQVAKDGAAEDQTEQSLEKLMELAAAALPPVTGLTGTLQQQGRHHEPKSRKFMRKYARNGEGDKKATSASKRTVFTEEDFERFSKEYFVHGQKNSSGKKAASSDKDQDWQRRWF